MRREDAVQKQLEQAALEGDAQKVRELLDEMEQLTRRTIQPEDGALFAARIRRLGRAETLKQEESTMKHAKILKRTLVAAALVAAVSVGSYASGVWKQFTYVEDDKLVTVRTTDQTATEKEMKGLDAASGEQAGDKALEDGEFTGFGYRVDENGMVEFVQAGGEDDSAGGALPQPVSYATVEEAEKDLDIQLPLPEQAGQMELKSALGHQTEYSKNLWLSYEGDGKQLGISWQQDLPTVPENVGITSIISRDIEPGSQGSYRSAKGYEFTTAREDGADVAILESDSNYEYDLTFTGFSQQEREAVLDSLDLSGLAT